MPEQQDFTTHIVDLPEPFGYCEARRMFAGCGIFQQGPMLTLMANGSLYLKADAACLHWTRLVFGAVLRKFSGHKKTKS